MIFQSRSELDTRETGKKIASRLSPGAILLFRGGLGAGKTTLTKGIAEGLGITDEITSPTFTLVNEYEGNIPLYHMDLYRIDGDEEFEMLGLEELLFGKGVTVIEWSEKIDRYFESVETIEIDLSIAEDQTRVIQVKGIEI